ncbi:MAG: type II toxin-antitoxin system VapC family toxin [Akkermansiaceae bacterium]|nr:type II toxin-antitoxin system VapC family toxin [Verrucomicrobiales bacterium]
MHFMLDTSAFSDLMREHPKLESRLAGCNHDDHFSICPIVRGEILHGISRLPEGQRRYDLLSKAAKLFAAIPCDPIVEAAADHYSDIKLTRQKKGLVLDENDLWIAASARAFGAVLVSRDSDFKSIDSLVTEDWTK